MTDFDPRPMKWCLDCDAEILAMGGGPRCASCQRGKRRTYDRGWRKVSKAAIAAHLREYGPVCPGWFGQSPHTVDPAELTGDHVTPRAAGGAGDVDNVAVLCRSCNSAKGARTSGGRIRFTAPYSGPKFDGPIRVNDMTGTWVVPPREESS